MNVPAHPWIPIPLVHAVFVVKTAQLHETVARAILINIVPFLRDPPTFLTASQDVAGCRLRIRRHILLPHLHLIMKSPAAQK